MRRHDAEVVRCKVATTGLRMWRCAHSASYNEILHVFLGHDLGCWQWVAGWPQRRWPARMILPVHDELVLEVEDGAQQEVGERISQLMMAADGGELRAACAVGGGLRTRGELG